MSENYQAPTLGRIVLFGCRELVAADGTKSVEERAAIVVRVWTPDAPRECVQLQVFLDGPNDRKFFPVLSEHRDKVPDVIWRSRVYPADDQAIAQLDRWRWPPRA